MPEPTNLLPHQQKAELVFKDYHLGLLAKITEYEHRVRVAEGRLEAEMTRAYTAEMQLDQANRQLRTVHALQRELVDLRSSTTWKIGRSMMFPVRLLRRLIGR